MVGFLLVAISACGGTPDPASATNCERSIDIFLDLTQDYLNVVSDLPPGEPPTDAAIEAERVLIENGRRATVGKLVELDCDSEEAEQMWCVGLPELDTGTYGRQLAGKSG